MTTAEKGCFSAAAKLAAERYGIGTLKAEIAMKSGMVSEAKRLHTDKGSYILRRLSGTAQAETEYRVSEILKGSQVCPEVLTAENGSVWMEMEEGVYNVQHWIEPLSTEPTEFDYGELGAKAGLMHEGLRQEKLNEQPDRFGLEKTWTTFLSRQAENVRHAQVRRLERCVQACLAEKREPGESVYIHGDLGRWNLVFGSEGIRIIDFGELRRGDRHFDLAALLTSTLKGSDAGALQNLNEFVRGYALHAIQCDRETLALQIRLWNVRGAAALLEQSGINERSLRHVEEMLNRYEEFERLLEKKEEE